MTTKPYSTALGLLFTLAFGAALPLAAAPPAGYQLTWSDDFNGHTLDTNKWSVFYPGPRRDALDVTNALSLARGKLTITSYSDGGKYYTSMISTEHKFMPVFGYWEARIKFQDSPGTWSAFWLESPTIGEPVGDPGKAGIEIDICEHRAVATPAEKIAGHVQHTLHWDGYGLDHKSRAHLTPDLHLDRGYHVYGLEWTPAEYRFYVDGQCTWTNSEAVSHAPEFMILSTEIENKAWAGHIPANGYGDLAHSQTKMTVDYVRYYSRKP